ncbi:DUF6879 family protein [Pseudonocardia acidicola]|uniref:DUF6879 domain-containing protein n=1 Tax=Pseudonocardia acidicola TaxID=2724939 RepID=A0ABX1S8W2_9PSEU|nr:DUF6879 family protein [Pseudonocardia acidicola]NMH97322.1 hypothetical protein [Pseudonocardia acidicola]
MREGSPMRISRLLADDCPNNFDCPRIYDTADGENVIVQGSTVTDPEALERLRMPEHESAVEVPRRLIQGVRPILTIDEFGEWVGRHHATDLFRLETLSTYASASDDQDFQRYLRGEDAPTAAAKEPWLKRLRADTDAGRRWRKVHLVRGELSDYERYEFEWGFTYTVEAGEDVRILDLAHDDRLAKLGELGDFFVLDGEYVARSRYGDEGRHQGFEILTEPAAHIVAAEFIWDAAEPFTSWWERHRQYHRHAA